MEVKKRIAVTMVLVCSLAVTGGVLYGLPYGTVYRIIAALEGQDRERLAEHVDFPRLRIGMKEQVRAAISTSVRDHDMERIGRAVMAQVLDKAVDEMITPDGLISLFRKNLGGRMSDPGNLAGRQAFSVNYPAVRIFMALFWRAHFAYASFTEFVVTLNDQKERSIRFILKRTGMTWRLVRVEVPVPAESIITK
jgi:hypothetical protein